MIPEKVITAFFRHVMEKGEVHHLPIQRYDSRNEAGIFIERYWRAINAPVYSSDGSKVAYILHTVEEITAQVNYCCLLITNLIS